LELYNNGYERTEKEIRLIDDALEKINSMMNGKNNQFSALPPPPIFEDEKKKRKSDDKKEGGKIKKPKMYIIYCLYVRSEEFNSSDILSPGDYVAVRAENQDWIMAIILRWMSDKGKYEVEDAEEDELQPGVRKYFLHSILTC
jgi:hypothetical protein